MKKTTFTFTCLQHSCRQLYQHKNMPLAVVLFLLANGVQASTLRAEIPALSNAVNEEQHMGITSPTAIQREVSGRVVDQQGQPVAGVTIRVKGGSTTTSTDKDGRFRIKADANVLLTIRAVGYKEQELSVPSSGELQVRLESLVNDLEEVVVVGYGTQKKINLTGAVGAASGEVLEGRPLVNLGQGLQGVIPNLNVDLNNGAPGKGAGFNIRGITSINKGSPLVLVDGVSMDLNLVDPNNVEQVSVLKDAASAAIYGARGAFGVILITTKTAKRNSPLKISYSGAYTLSRPTRMPKSANSIEYFNMYREADRTGRATGGSGGDTFTAADSVNIWNHFNNPSMYPSAYPDPNKPSHYRYVGNEDWLKVLYPGWAPQQNHSVSLTGGSDKVSYSVNLGALSQDGLLKEADQRYKRYNGAIKLDASVTSWLDLKFGATLNNSRLNTPNGTKFVNDNISDWSWLPQDLSPLMPVYHPDGNFAGQGGFTNMIAVMKLNGRAITDINDTWVNGGFVLKPFKNFRIVTDYAWNNKSTYGNQHYIAFPEYGVNGILGTYTWTTPSRVTESAGRIQYYALNSYMEYENTFAEKHYFKAMVGYNQEERKYRTFGVTAKDLIDPTRPNLVPNADANPVVVQNINDYGLSGTFGRINYMYDDRYLLEINARYDGTSRFARNKNYVLSPSASIGWRISREKFMDNLKSVVNDLKLRASYGSLANQGLEADVETNANYYPYIAQMPVGRSSYIFNTLNGVTISAPGLVRSDFTWEKVSTLNFGLDFASLNNRLNASFDVFTRRTSDMIIDGVPLPAVLGTTTPKFNGADLKTQGWEASINWKDKHTNDFAYSVGLVLSDSKAKITKYDNPYPFIGQYYKGYEFGETWGFVTDGFFQSDAEAKAADQKDLTGVQLLAGDIKYADLNGDKKITRGDNSLANPGDRKIIGNNTARYNFGLNLGASYKNFDITVFFQGVLKRDYWLGGVYFWGFSDQWSVPRKENLDSWSPENRDAYFPRQRFDAWFNMQTQTKYKQNAAYARLKQLSIGYTLPTAVAKKMKLDRLRIYFTGQNLFELTSLYKAFDPELSDGQGYPLSRGVSFGVQIGL